MSHTYPTISVGSIRKGDRIRTETTDGTYLPDTTGVKVTAMEWIAEKNYTDEMAMDNAKFYLIERPVYLTVSGKDVNTFRKWFRADHTLTPDQDSAIAIFLDSIQEPPE